MKGSKIIYKAVALVLSIASVVELSARDANAFFMPNAIDRLDNNVALTIGSGYFSMPLLGGVNLSTNGNMSISDLLYPVDGSLMLFSDPAVSSSSVLGNLNSGDNRYSLGADVNLFGLGGYTRKDWFWSVGLSLKTTMGVNMPYDLAYFMKKAPQQTTIKGLEISADSYAEMAFGMSVPIDDKLRVGGRVKVLFGLARAKVSIDEMTITANEDIWMAEGKGTIDINVGGVEQTSGSSTFEMDDVDFGTMNSLAGIGFGMDFGATYQLLDQLQLSASVNNLGFIRWKADSNLHGEMSPEFTFSGIKYDANTGESTEANFDLDDMLLFEEQEAQDDVQSLQADLNLGAQYSLWKDRVSAGMFYTAEFMNTYTQHSITAGASVTPIKCISLSAAYTIYTKSTNTLGLALNFYAPGINIYLASTLFATELTPQFLPVNQTSTDISLGISFSLASREKKLKKGEKK